MNRTARRRHMPRIFTSPPSNLDMNVGAEMAELTELAGRPLHTWQHTVLEKATRVDEVPVVAGSPTHAAAWTWSANEVGLLTGRRNGKTTLVEARELAGMYTLHEHIVYTALNGQAARFRMDCLLQVIDSSPHLSRYVEKVNRTRGAEGILLKTGGAIRFCARGPASIDAAIDADLLVIDDAYHVPDSWAAGVVHGTAFRRPTSRRRQVWYVGTAVDHKVHPQGRVFTAVRNRGLSGTDTDLCWIEYSAPDTRDENGKLLVGTTDPAVIARANPSERLDLARVARRARVLTPSAYEAEHLAIGNWPDLAAAAA